MVEKRRFVRHPICYPLEFEQASRKIRQRCQTKDISEGGLLFLSTHQVECGQIIILKLPIQNKLFKIAAKVVHTRTDAENPKLYNVGVSFQRYSDAFKVKLIEQIYLIDEYRALCSLQLGREISLEEASKKWIKLYSERFDKMFWGKGVKKTKKEKSK